MSVKILENATGKKTDIRTIETKKKIKTIFLDLLREKAFSEITVSELIARAGINRSTFYAHFNDKYDLKKDIEGDLIQQLRDIGADSINEFVTQDYSSKRTTYYFRQFGQFIYDNGELFVMFSGKDGDPSFFRSAISCLRMNWEEFNLAETSDIPQNYVFSAMLGMVTGITLEWIDNGFLLPLEEFCNITTRMMEKLYDELKLKA